jgi:hypothetical protein
VKLRIREAQRANERQRGRTVQAEAEQAVEAGHVIHMRMGHEDVAHPQQFAG